MENMNEEQPDQTLSTLAPHDDHPSFSSDSRPMIFFNPVQDQHGGFYKEAGETENSLKLAISWKKEDDHGVYNQDENNNQKEYGSVKWMSSKMRMMRKMISSEQTPSNLSVQKRDQDHHKQPSSISSLETTDHSSNSSYSNNNNTPIRVCADCNTTKTPLWRSGPRGPKSLCNACGIRQRKARRAMAAAAAAAGDATVPAPDSPSTKNKTKPKDKKSNDGVVPIPFKKRFKVKTPSSSRGRKKICFEDRLSMNLGTHSSFQQVFPPQDEIKEAAILLMSLSYGLVQG